LDEQEKKGKRSKVSQGDDMENSMMMRDSHTSHLSHFNEEENFRKERKRNDTRDKGNDNNHFKGKMKNFDNEQSRGGFFSRRKTRTRTRTGTRTRKRTRKGTRKRTRTRLSEEINSRKFSENSGN